MNNSAKRVLDVLELMASSEPMTMKEIGDVLGIPKSSIFDLVNILHERDFLAVDDPRAKTYTLGVAAYRVGTAYAAQSDLYRLAHPILRGLTEAIGTTGYLGIEEQGELIYLDKSESRSPISFSMRIGSRNHLHSTALGKALLAAKSDGELIAFAQKGLVKKTPHTLTTVEALLAEMEETRRRGYAIDDGEDNALLYCLGAPIRNGQNKVVAAISVTSLWGSMTDEERSRRAAMLIEAATQISRTLGYVKQTLY